MHQVWFFHYNQVDQKKADCTRLMSGSVRKHAPATLRITDGREDGVKAPMVRSQAFQLHVEELWVPLDVACIYRIHFLHASIICLWSRDCVCDVMFGLVKSQPKDRSFFMIAWLLLFEGFLYSILHADNHVWRVSGWADCRCKVRRWRPVMAWALGGSELSFLLGGSAVRLILMVLVWWVWGRCSVSSLHYWYSRLLRSVIVLRYKGLVRTQV